MQDNNYSNMQRRVYDSDGHNWSLENRWRVVGPFDEHNKWEDNRLLFKDVPNHEQRVCLEFGCGPGRNLVNYFNSFKRIDGVDISSVILDKAKIWLAHNNCDVERVTLHHCNGYDLSSIKNDSYDLVFSTICFQHICVHEIRFNLLKEFFRVLRPDGYLSIQMGFGYPSPKTVPYYDNFYDAQETNRACDTSVEKVEFIEDDIKKVGFVDFRHYITQVGPGDFHPNWIYWNCRKPN